MAKGYVTVDGLTFVDGCAALSPAACTSEDVMAAVHEGTPREPQAPTRASSMLGDEDYLNASECRAATLRSHLWTRLRQMQIEAGFEERRTSSPAPHPVRATRTNLCSGGFFANARAVS